MLTPKQNLLEVLNWGNPEYVPLTFEAMKIVGFLSNGPIESPTDKDGLDPFGVLWHVTSEGCIPDSSKFILEDITEWKEYIKFPDTDAIDLKPFAEAELKDFDSEQQMLTYYHPNGLFERLSAFMGFEECLISLVSEPEACMEFFEVLADYKIACMKKIHEAYKPDIYVYLDDLATARGTFMSPQTYRDVIKPAHKRIVDACKELGMIFFQHTCGKCEDLLEDYVDIGIGVWSSAQIMNDLTGIQERFNGRMVIEGGWDTVGKCSQLGSSADEIRAETRRAINEYGPRKGFILQPTLLNERGNSLFVGDDRLAGLFEEWAMNCRIY